MVQRVWRVAAHRFSYFHSNDAKSETQKKPAVGQVERLVLSKQPTKVQLYAVDHSARASMKSAASCVN